MFSRILQLVCFHNFVFITHYYLIITKGTLSIILTISDSRTFQMQQNHFLMIIALLIFLLGTQHTNHLSGYVASFARLRTVRK